MNKILNILSLLAEESTKVDDKDVINKSYQAFIRVVNTVLPILIGVLLVLGMFYGIQLGVKYAHAEDDEKRKNARQSLINVAVGIIIAVIFIAVVEIILNQTFIQEMFPKLNDKATVASLLLK